MRVSIRHHHVSFDPLTDWVPDVMEPATEAQHGMYARSVEHGLYLNVRSQDSGGYPLSPDGLAALLHAQAWASPPFDVWSELGGTLTVVGGSFETKGMGGEVVLEVFVTDGRGLVNLVAPGERAQILAMTPSVRLLARSLRFG